jgi:hypothetical protein
MEELLTDRVINCSWRLARAATVERSNMDDAYDNFLRLYTLKQLTPEQNRRRAVMATVNNKNLEQIHRYEITIERQLYRALHELQYLQASRLTGVPLVPGAFHVSVVAPWHPPGASSPPNAPLSPPTNPT